MGRVKPLCWRTRAHFSFSLRLSPPRRPVIVIIVSRLLTQTTRTVSAARGSTIRVLHYRRFAFCATGALRFAPPCPRAVPHFALPLPPAKKTGLHYLRLLRYQRTQPIGSLESLPGLFSGLCVLHYFFALLRSCQFTGSQGDWV